MRPIGDRVVVQPDKEEDEVTAGGVYLPKAQIAGEAYQYGTVSAVGQGRYDNNGNLIPIEVAVGDRVIYSKYGGVLLTEKGEELLVIRESDLLAVV